MLGSGRPINREPRAKQAVHSLALMHVETDVALVCGFVAVRPMQRRCAAELGFCTAIQGVPLFRVPLYRATNSNLEW